MTELVEVSIHLQAWIDEMAREVDDSPVRFTIPREDAMVEGELVPDKHRLSDKLKQHENAPERVQKWKGPFYVEVDNQ